MGYWDTYIGYFICSFFLYIDCQSYLNGFGLNWFFEYCKSNGVYLLLYLVLLQVYCPPSLWLCWFVFFVDIVPCAPCDRMSWNSVNPIVDRGFGAIDTPHHLTVGLEFLYINISLFVQSFGGYMWRGCIFMSLNHSPHSISSRKHLSSNTMDTTVWLIPMYKWVYLHVSFGLWLDLY